MSTGSPRRRDTFAFVLTIVGATFWAVFPVHVLLRAEGIGREIATPITFAAGAFIGAWTGTTVWRHVSRAVPAVAAGLVAALMMFGRGLERDDFTVIEMICVIAAIVGAAVGTGLGWRAQRAQRALAAAWITLGGPLLLAVSFNVLHQLGYTFDREALVLITFLAFVPASILATRLCRGVHPRSFVIWMFGILASAFLVIFAYPKGDRDESADAEKSNAAAFAASIVFSAITTGICSIPVRIAFRRQPQVADLPTAQMRDS